MLNIEFSQKNIFENLLSLSELIGAQIITEKKHSYMILDGNYGSGIIAISKVSDTITNLCFDITFTEDVKLSFLKNNTHCVDFIYCLEGSLQHSFSDTSAYETINFRQNSIISRSPKSTSIFKFPNNVALKVNIIVYNNIKVPSTRSASDVEQLRDGALLLMSNSFTQNNNRYLGRVCYKTAVFAKSALEYSLKSSSDIIFKEAAILNTLASQLERYTKDTQSSNNEAPIKFSEIDKIIALENFINDNVSEDLTVERLVSLSGLNAAKLQIGFKYLFDKTISCYVREKRLEKAVNLIKETEYNVSELVYSVGFTSRSYFSKIFKERYGVLPSQCVSNPNLLMAV